MMHAKSPLPPSFAPFKGEAFPAYVLQRVTRGAPLQSGSVSTPLADATVSTVARRSVHLSPVAASAAAPNLALSSGSPSVVSHTTTAAQTWQSAAPPRTVASPLGSSSLTRGSRTPQRPSLSDQLRTISQSAQDITTQLKTTYKLQPGNLAPPTLCASGTSSSCTTATAATTVLLQATTVGITVGKLACRFPCPVAFLHDHCTFVFQHPFAAREIHMVMFYRDMVHASVTMRDKRFRFRIARVLEHFGDDYDPRNAQHAIQIVFATISETERVKHFVLERRIGVGGS